VYLCPSFSLNKSSREKNEYTEEKYFIYLKKEAEREFALFAERGLGTGQAGLKQWGLLFMEHLLHQ